MTNEEWNKAPTGFREMADIINIQNNVLQQISGQKSTLHFNGASDGKTLAEVIRQHEVNNIDAIIKEYTAQEDKFYSQYPKLFPTLSRDTKRSDKFNTLRTYVENWNNSGAVMMLQDSNLITQIQQVFYDSLQADLGEAASKLEQIVNDDAINMFNGDMFNKEFEQLGIAASKIVASGLKGSTSSRSGTIYVKFEAKDDLGSSKLQTGYTFMNDISDKKRGITIFRPKHGNTFEIHFTQDIPANDQKRITTRFKEELEKSNITVNGTTIVEIAEKISDIINSYLSIKITKQDMIAPVQKAVTDIIKEYMIDKTFIAVSRNTSVIRGMLGEVYWNAFFRYFGISAIPTGVDVKSLTSKEIPVDIALRAFGAQVKNYTKINDVITFNQHLEKGEMTDTKVSLSSFLTSASYMQLPSAEIFGKFWFAERYNRQNKSIDQKNKYMYVEQRFNPISSGINTYFQSALSNLLSLSKNIELKNPPEYLDPQFNGGKPQFFIMDDNIYPTSGILNYIKEQLLGNTAEELFVIRLKNYEINLQPFDNAVTNQWPKEVDKPDISQRLKESKITYSIDINLTNLMTYIVQHPLD